MFIHNLKYSLKSLFKNKMLIFWTFAFPIILGTFFNLAFSDIENSEKLDIIDIAIVKEKNNDDNKVYLEAFKELSSKDNEDRLFKTKYVTKNEAKKLLEEDEISGYLVLNDDVKIVVKQNGINETIIKQVTEEIRSTSKTVNDIATKEIENEIKKGNYNINYENIYINVSETVMNSSSNIKNISSKNLSYTMIEFYTLIAMACLYGGMLGITSINQNLPNMSNKGKRISVSNSKKSTIVLSSALASYIVQIIGLVLLFVYTIFVLNVDYGNDLLKIIILALAGSLCGLSIGIMIASTLKTNESSKTGILISVTMLGCFLSGMMGITMKYVIDTNAPIVNKLNPASMITDGFYSLYYYTDPSRYYFNLSSLIIFALIMITISMFSLRRQKYDSI